MSIEPTDRDVFEACETGGGRDACTAHCTLPDPENVGAWYSRLSAVTTWLLSRRPSQPEEIERAIRVAALREEARQNVTRLLAWR